MLGHEGLSVSMTAQLGDALLTILKQDLQVETDGGTARRRLELFVLHAQTLLVHLADRIDGQDQRIRELEDALHTERQDRMGALNVVQTTVELIRRDVAEAVATLTETQQAEIVALQQTQQQLMDRIAELERRTWRARFVRLRTALVQAVSGLWR